MPHPRGVRRERTLCGICRARGVNARTCPARDVGGVSGAGSDAGISGNVEKYGEQYREWVAEAHSEMMQPRKFAEMMRERMAEFNGQSTLNVGLPIPEPVDVDEDEVESDAEMPSSTERLIRAIMAGVEAFIDDLQT
jgi:hypothetical protein